MKPLFVALPGNMELATALASSLDAEVATTNIRQFPDGESYLRFDTALEGRDVVIVCTLNRPDALAMPLFFAADACRDLGAASIGLVAPYLAYMRQDERFQPGEAVTSRYFSTMISRAFDWMLCVDPHLHRFARLDALYSIPSQIVHASESIAVWVASNVVNPVLVGPDSESEQWVAAVATSADLPYVILEKVRSGDRDVAVSGWQSQNWVNHTPVVLDDIISTARTMIETVEVLLRADMAAPVCIGIHGVFADNAHDDLLRAGAQQVVTCNTIPHMSNGIDVTALLAGAIATMLRT
ncbi:MAG: ribose-phosphate pyrophosphokinase [Bradymonadaceae bacterium]|nr:ribose-phosphate pyrophosphokinase [Lujinxingiaceae bacterium]